MRYLVADTETTDKVPFKDQNGNTFGGVVEISVREVNRLSLETTNEWHSLLNPQGPISASAAGVHGIREHMVADKPTFADYVAENAMFDSYGEPVYIIAHNVKFDRQFMEPYVGNSQLVWGPGEVPDLDKFFWVDTLKLARRLYPDAPDHKLPTLTVYLELPFDVSATHSASGDTQNLLNLVRHMVETSGKSLHELCLWALEPDEHLVMPFGKHKGRTFEELGRSERGYLNWMLKQTDMDPDVQRAARKALGK